MRLTGCPSPVLNRENQQNSITQQKSDYHNQHDPAVLNADHSFEIDCSLLRIHRHPPGQLPMSYHDDITMIPSVPGSPLASFDSRYTSQVKIGQYPISASALPEARCR